MITLALSEVFIISLVYPVINILSNDYDITFIDRFNFISKFIGYQDIQNMIIILFIFAVIFISSLRAFYTFFKHRICAVIGTDFGYLIYSRNLSRSYLEILNITSSEFISVCTIHVEKTSIAINNFLEMITSILVLTSIIVTLLFIEFKIVITAILFFSFFYFLLILKLKDKLLRNSITIVKQNKQQIKLIQETFNSFKIILIQNAKEYFKKIFFNQEYEMRIKAADNKFLEELPRSITESAGIIALVLFAFFTKNDVNREGVALLGTFAFAAQRLLPAFQRVFSNFAALRSRQKNVDLVIKYLNKPIMEDLSEQNYKKMKSFKKIEFKNVSFKYNPKKSNILEKINLEIVKGDKVAIIGETGSGKSTFLDLFLGFLDPYKGEILINGKKLFHNKNEGLKKAWRELISIVPQRIFLMEESIDKNIAFTFEESEINREKINSVIKIANLIDFVKKPEIGLNYGVGENGNFLSGGQIQRIAIARAIYRNFEILILDEANSALDSSSSKIINDNLLKTFPNKTFICVSHKIESFDNFNKVIQIKNGFVDLIKY